MKIGNVNIEGFMGVGSAALGLTDRGLVLIQGENKDDASATSNGAGKSTLPDALSWCLYGVTARGESGDDIINNLLKTASVVIELHDDDGTSYRVGRYRKDKTHKNHVILEKLVPEGTDINLTLSSDKETQLRIDQVIGCDVTVFNAAIYQGQESIPDMPNMSDKQIKGLIELAAGISVLEECYKIALFEKNEKEKELDRCGIRQLQSFENLQRAESDLYATQTAVDDWDLDQKVKFDAANVLVESSLASKTEANAKLGRAEEKVPTINANIAKHKAILEEKSVCDNVLSGLSDQKHDQESNVRLAQSTVDQSTRAVKQSELKVNGIEKRIGTACGECGKPIQDIDLATVKTGAEMVVSQMKKNLEAAQANVELEQDSLEGACARYDEYKAAMPDYTETSERLNKCQLIIAAIETVRAETKGFDVAHASAASHAKAVGEEVNPYEIQVESGKAKVTAAKKEVKEIKKEMSVLVDAVQLAIATMAVYSPAGVRAHILDHVTPFLNARTAHYLSALSDGNLSAIWSTVSFTKKGEMREKFSIQVSNITGGKKFGLLSGGEKRKVRLSCAMALQDVVSGRATKPIELFMADEIDDALDPAGLERLMGILEEKARERGTVLVISHNSLSDWIREVAVVRKEGGFSSIHGALNV